MQREALLNLADSGQFIPGIYNYCDRWCERCDHTSRCLNYAMGRELDHECGYDADQHDLQSEQFWRRLESVLQMALDTLADIVTNEEVEVTTAEMKAWQEDEQRLDDLLDEHPLAVRSEAYADSVTEWFEAHECLFQSKGEELESRARMGLDEDDPLADVVAINDAVEVVRWYQCQIHVKLCRALDHSHCNPASAEEAESLQSDADGSAKVALLGLDRSLTAWALLRRHLPEEEDSVLDLLIQLDRLRRETELAFPNARAFKRPGFDEEID